MSKRVTDSNVWNLSVKEHFDILDDISMLYDDMDFVKEIWNQMILMKLRRL